MCVCRDARPRGSYLRAGDRAADSARRRHRSRSRSRNRDRDRSRDRGGRTSSSPFSRGTDTEDGEVKEPTSPPRPGAPLSSRQMARLADLSLLLQVVLKTDYARYGPPSKALCVCVRACMRACVLS